MRHLTALTGRQIFDRSAARLVAILQGHSPQNTRRLADDYSHPYGAGVIGPGADGLLRAVLVEALTVAPGSVEVLTTGHDLEHLFGEMVGRVPYERLRGILHVAGTVEETVEHVEDRVLGVELRFDLGRKPMLWTATPGADADVVHRTLNSCPAGLLTGLFSGPWPYGPTHLIEANGPRPRPRRPVRLLSPQQAVARLHLTIPQA
ncbi:hypothetical protein [Actinomadura sp. 9N407]|uniref:hypothetical protein n=1 Tax=Actinomadura sp. 9N407 TaxID=3375154 RepID=UPI0037974CE4